MKGELDRQLETWRSSLDNDIREERIKRQSRAFQQGLVLLLVEFRTRFYHARFLLYRPFVFKALHFSERMTSRDVQCYLLAMESACLYPISMGPVNEMKRLIPHLFTWTPHFIGLFLVLWVAQNDEQMYRAYMGQLDRDKVQQTHRSHCNPLRILSK